MTAEQAWQELLHISTWAKQDDAVRIIAAYGAERKAKGYREGVEAMRDEAHSLMRWPEDHIGLDNIAFRLLKGAPK